ncbi:tetratricopeptide repeat protein [Stappia taiwanensis]|uniref:Tetratricopeptide repeat protein 38 n=1 Tax=Stappia taiwanensis TaxID=992267 RepID=A0A838XVQ5_9HYPH|nr:tetratricopeptide repeat protein [Stappia taiwanensis]MBA4612576.1 tetratricopeptide repeat protein [Stappia taiwanensis]GGE89380.1 tetratricopeptide repeat protein 38 family protein [Stappia taiwanensis]
MSIIDPFGYPLTLTEPEALAPWSGTVNAFLAHGKATPDLIGEALACDPQFAMGHATHGLFCLLLGRRELLAVAEGDWRDADAARRLAPVTARETVVIDALRDWLDGFPRKAAARLDAALADFPADPLLMKLAHAIYFVLGEAAAMRRSVEKVLPVYGADHPALGYTLGCHAFALEETGAYAEAERAGRQALELAADDAWGLHAVAHVYDMTGQAETGRKWLEGHTATFAHCNNFGYHVWWHLALMYLDKGDIGEVLWLYDTRIRRDHTDDYRDISNAASLLVRLEIEGVDVGQRWEELARLAETRIDDRCNVFANLHYMLSLSGGGRRQAADRMLSALSGWTEDHSDMGEVAARTGLPVAQGLEAYQRGNFFSAFHHLDRARPGLQSIGGSHAQRDVFEQLAIDAALRAGLAEDAERLLRERQALRGATDRFASERLAQVERMRRAERVMGDEGLRAVPL